MSWAVLSYSTTGTIITNTTIISVLRFILYSVFFFAFQIRKILDLTSGTCSNTSAYTVKCVECFAFNVNIKAF